jgi:hypothetical protein
MKCIAYTRQDGGVSVVHPHPEFVDKIEIIADKDVPAPIQIYDVPTGNFEMVIDEETGEEFQKEIMNSRTHVYYYKILNTSDLPPRETRSAWQLDLNESNADGKGLTKEEFDAKYPELKGWTVK